MLNTDQISAVLWRRRVSLLLTSALVFTAIAVTTFLLPKSYSTSSYLLVSSAKAATSDFEASQVNQVLTKTYAELLQTRGVANQVAQRLPFPSDGKALQGAVQIAPVQQAQLIQITAQGSSPERAQTIANVYAQSFVAGVGAGSLNGRVTLAQPAAVISNAVSPRPKLYLIIGAFLALLAGAGVALGRQRFDQRLHVEPSSTEVLDLPIIGRIPQRSSAVMESLPHTGGARDPATRQVDEAFRLVMANLSFVGLGRRPATLVVVSASEGEGKSTASFALARAAAELGIRTLLVDADLRRPRLSAMMSEAGRAGGGAGLSAFLSNLTPLALSELIVGLAPSLDFMPSGPPPPNPAALLASKALADLDRRAQRAYDLVVYDSPPLSVGADATLLAAAAEGVILVVDPRRAKRSRVVQAVDQLRRTQAHVLGVVVNRAAGVTDHDYYSSGQSEPVEVLAAEPVAAERVPAPS